MSLTASSTGAWAGSIDSNRLVFGQDAPRAPHVAEQGYHWEAKEYVITRTQQVSGVTAYAPKIGHTAGGDTITIYNGDDQLTGNVAQTYTCQDDRLEPDPPGSGIWRHEEVWKTVTDWVETKNGDEA